MGFKICLLVLMVVLAMVAKSQAKIHEATWALGHYAGHDDHDSLIDSAHTKVGDLIGEENEMMMDSETSRRTLAGRRKFIGYGALRKNAVPCGRRGNSYYNCQARERANPYRRGCAYITRCARR